MSKSSDGLGIPDDPRFLLPKDRGEKPAEPKRPLLLGEMGWPVGKAGRQARAKMQRVCAEGTGE